MSASRGIRPFLAVASPISIRATGYKTRSRLLKPCYTRAFTTTRCLRQEAAATTPQRVDTPLSKADESESKGLRSLTDGLQDPPPVLDENEKQVDWTRSFHGLSSEPFSSEQSAILQQPLDEDDVEIKPDGIIYLPEIKYRRILNKAFGPGGWGLAPRGETLITSKVVTREYAMVVGGR